MGFHDHFSDHADAYAAFRPHYPAALVTALAEASPATGTAWDVGCGSGQLSGLLTASFAHVIATDPSAEQLKNAAVTPRVSFRCAPAEQSGLEPGSVDCIVAAQAAHWFDMPAFVAECRRVGRPEALVTLVSYGLMFIRPDLDVHINSFALETLADFWPPERRHVDTGYAELFFPVAPVVLPPLSMTATWDLTQVLGYVGTWSAVARARKDGQGALFDTFAQDLAARWGAPTQTRTVEWPLTLKAGRLG